jgi:nitroreductase
MTQPWRFKIYTGDALKRLANELPDLYKKIEGENFKPKKAEKMKKRAESVSALTFICMARDKDEKIPEIEEIEAVACSVQNMLLTCTAYGLGGYWSSPKMVYDKSMNEFLGLGEKDRCLGIFYMGYPEGDWPKSHRTPLEYVTEWIDQ